VAIVQISQITNRKGLQIDLPQLAGAELGWSVDERRLFIGNGTLEEGAPTIGNTEILTEFSDILNFQTTYTYKGAAAGYVVQTGPTPGSPVTQSLQSWLDQWASVKDFGAVGDGVTDDTAAINRALYQLFCRETNPQIRRSLFFPAGVYLVNQSIDIPTYATLYGEGADNSVIRLAAGDDSALRAYVARTADSLQQTDANIGTNGATPPKYITISNMGFETVDQTYGDVFLVDQATDCVFTNVNFVGPFTTSNLTSDSVNMAGVRFNSGTSFVCQDITFDRCGFSGTDYGINTDEQIQGITVSNSKFDTLYQGILLGTGSPVNGGPTGFRILHNFFNNIYAEGIKIGAIQLNATGYNIFYDVGNHFAGTTSPATAVIVIGNSNNISVGDLFERGDAYATVHPRIDLENNSSIGFVNGKLIELGPNVIETEPITTLNNNTTATFYSFDATLYRSVSVNYSVVRDTGVRHGTFRVVPTGGGALTYDDDYVENTTLGLSFSASQAGSNVSITYTTTNTGIPATLTYSISKFRV
jgi:hypothetical protein